MSMLVPAVVRYAQGRGVDVEPWRWRFGLPPDVTGREELASPADAVEELFEAVAMATSDRDVALRVAETLGGSRLRLLELAVRASADVHHALIQLARWTPLLQGGLEASLDGGTRWVLRAPRRPRGIGRYVQELALAYPLLQVRQGAASVPVLRAWFVHPRPRSIDGLLAFFGTGDIAFGCEDSGFLLAPDVLQLPCPTRTLAPWRPWPRSSMPSSLPVRSPRRLQTPWPRG
jgi:hypothetical protein